MSLLRRLGKFRQQESIQRSATYGQNTRDNFVERMLQIPQSVDYFLSDDEWRRALPNLIIISHYTGSLEQLASMSMNVSAEQRADVFVLTETCIDAITLRNQAQEYGQTKVFRLQYPNVILSQYNSNEDVMYNAPLPKGYLCMHNVLNGCSDRCRAQDVLFSNSYFTMDNIGSVEKYMRIVYIVYGKPTEAVAQFCRDSIEYSARIIIIERTASSRATLKMANTFKNAGKSVLHVNERWKKWKRRLSSLLCCCNRDDDITGQTIPLLR